MRILLVHNRYQHIGGEESVLRSEQALLEAHGHEVRLFETNNDAIRGLSAKIWATVGAVYSVRSRRRFECELQEFRPDIVHAHNLFPVLSPSVLCACAAAHSPVVQTLHNYRLLCPNALLFRDGAVCEDCVGKSFAYPGALRGCYRNSRIGSLSSAIASLLTRRLKYRRHRFIALTEFARKLYVAGGLPEDRISVKPNFVERDPGTGSGAGGYFVFVGRLSEEKGLGLLLRAWKALAGRAKLKIIGSGPLQRECERAARENRSVEFIGPKAPHDVFAAMADATALVFPSLCYEGLPKTILEAFATGTPVIASNIGSASGLIEHGVSGLHFTRGDAASLVAQVEWMLVHLAERQQLRRNARAEYQRKYSAEQNYAVLMGIYERTMSNN